MSKQYFYKNNQCKAIRADEAECICWHDEGTGPLPNAKFGSDSSLPSWREKPSTPEQQQIKKLDFIFLVFVVADILMICFLVYLLGKHIYYSKDREAEHQRKREVQKSNMQSLIGKKVTAISGLEKPIIISLEGGGEIEVDCYKYPIQIEYSPSK